MEPFGPESTLSRPSAQTILDLFLFVASRCRALTVPYPALGPEPPLSNLENTSTAVGLEIDPLKVSTRFGWTCNLVAQIYDNLAATYYSGGF